MNITILNEDIFRTLLKYSYIYIGELDEAKKLVEESLRKSQKKFKENTNEKDIFSIIWHEVIKSCRRYSRSMRYQKESVLKIVGIRWYGENLRAWKRINKLPNATKEVAIFHFVFGQSSMQISKTLNIPPGTVQSHLHKAKSKLSIITNEEEQKFTKQLQTELEIIEEVEDLPQISLHLPKKQKRKKKNIVIISAVIVTACALFFFLKPDKEQVAEQQSPTEINSPNDGIEETTVQIDPIVITEDIALREVDELAFKISAYNEFFHNYYTFYSAKEAKLQAVVKIYRAIMTIQYANERNIFLDEYEQKTLVNLTNNFFDTWGAYIMEEEDIKNALEFFHISEEEYKNSYLRIRNEAALYESKLYDMQINMEDLYNRIYSDSIPEEYYEKVNITLQDVEEVRRSWENYSYEELTEPQVGTPFDLSGSNLKIVQLENGEYVLENPTHFGIYSTKYGEFISNSYYKSFSTPLTRATLNEHIELLENYDTDSETNKQYAKEVAEVYKMLKKSIEWDVY